MCGIFGALHFQHSIDHLDSVSKKQIHRGPDQWNRTFSEDYYFATNRLVIRDLPYSEQPYITPQNNILLFNGEIYNLQELKQKLEIPNNYRSEVQILGYIFEISTDLEAVIKLINGIFAIAFYNTQNKELSLVRDHFGVKPLFYYHNKESFFFASEISTLQSLLPSPDIYNKTSLSHFFECNYINAPATIFRQIKSIPPASILKLKDSERPEFQTFWQLENLPKPPNNVSNSPQDIIYKGIDRQFEHNQKQALFLSSGVDSTLIALRAKHNDINLECFTVIYDEDSSDQKITQENCKKLNFPHHCIKFTANNFINSLEQANKIISQPLADPGFYALYYLAGHIPNDIKVCFTGDGADEIHFGYPTYWATGLTSFPLPWRLLSHFISSNFQKKQFKEALKVKKTYRHAAWRKVHNLKKLYLKDVEEQYLKQYSQVHSKNSLTAAQISDLSYWLPSNNLFKADVATMAHSLEARVPYLDLEVATFFLDKNFKRSFPPLKRKEIIYQTFNKCNNFNLEIMAKKSFTPPYKEWFAKPLYNYLGDHFQSFDWARFGISKHEVMRMLEKHQRNEVDYTYHMLNLISFIKFTQFKG